MCKCHPAGDGCVECKPWNQGHNFNDGARLGEPTLKAGEFLMRRKKTDKQIPDAELYCWMAVIEDSTELQNWCEMTVSGKTEIFLCKH